MSISSLAGDSKNDKKTQIEILVLSTPEINLDIFNRPTPIRLDLYQMTEQGRFNYSTYLDLIDEDNSLNKKLITRTQYMIHPDEVEFIIIDIDKDTKYLGVTGGFKNIDETNWRLTLFKQPSNWMAGNNGYLYLKVNSAGIKQISKREMKAELKRYAKEHPDNKNFDKYGRFKKPDLDYSKGIFVKEQ